MTTVKGNVVKMQSRLADVVHYTLPIGQQLIPMNPLVGHPIKIHFTGEINDIYDGQPIKKSYGQGYSYRNFRSLARCDYCIVQPEKCHFHHGTCREPQWGEQHCLTPHVVYLSLTSSAKVGVTRHTQIPTRWIDQGAVKAIPLVRVNERLNAGLIEVELKSAFEDKTNWRKMLTNDYEPQDLAELREMAFGAFADLFDDHCAEEIEAGETSITYPVKKYPTTIRSLNAEKNPLIQEVLYGIKGQYLIFEQSVLNMRNHQGYFIELSY